MYLIHFDLNEARLPFRHTRTAISYNLLALNYQRFKNLRFFTTFVGQRSYNMPDSSNILDY
jgi:hypothetical protein